MIFKETWQQVLNGTKTQTRRPVKPNESGVVFPAPFQMVFVMTDWQGETLDGFDCQVRDRRRLKWQVGKTYAVQPGRGKRSIGRIRITKIRRERLQEMSALDCRAEMGVSNGDPRRFAIYLLPKFIKLWNSLYRKAPHRWQDNPECWALEFERVIGKEEEG